MYNWNPGYSFATGALFGVSGWGYPAEFGFRWTETETIISMHLPIQEWNGDGELMGTELCSILHQWLATISNIRSRQWRMV